MLNTGTELRELRLRLQQALTGHPQVAKQGLADVPERMVLVATELATNAIKHGRPLTVIRLLCSDDEFILDLARPGRGKHSGVEADPAGQRWWPRPTTGAVTVPERRLVSHRGHQTHLGVITDVGLIRQLEDASMVSSPGC